VGLITDYPFWYILLCILLGLAVAGLLYYKNRRDGFPVVLRWLLAAMRFVVVSLLAFLLLGPLVERFVRQVEEPLLIFVQDNSESLVLGNDSLFYQTTYKEQHQDFLQQASRDFDTRHYVFGESFRLTDSLDFTDRLTDMAAVFRGLEARYSNRNVGAVVLASDGIYNRGLNPLHVASGKPYPVYTLALGDTTVHRDVLINRISHNRITYLGNIFPVEVVVEARQSHGLSSRLTVSREGEILFSQNISFSGPLHLETLMIELEATEPGMKRYQVAISPVEAEVNIQNNRQDFYVEVIDGRQRVLLLANSPHPDVGALKQTLDDNQNYEVDVKLFEDFDGNPEPYNLVILHQLPSDRHMLSGFDERLAQAEVPALFIVGNQTNLRALNGMRAGLSIQPRSGDLTEALPELNPAFATFSLSDELTAMLGELPPLHVPFASYQVAAGGQVMLYQRIGAVSTQQPLLLFSDDGLRKTGIIAGEGLWRWRLQAYARQGHSQGFDALVSRVVQYLSLKEDRSLFRVHGEQFFYENEPVLFEAELYNPSYELVNEPEVQFTIYDEEDVAFPYTMARTSNAYMLDAGTFAPGSYRWEANTSLGGERFSADGIFTVSPLNIEGLQTVADHALLFQLADATGAGMYYPNQWDDLWQHIQNRDDINPVMYSSKEFNELINLKLIFFLLLLLLASEWFLRKRSGSY
jgi:hypothetical protein